jgi:DNA-nicking Smr family endonuclease
MRHRTNRPLQDGEIALWAHVTRSIRPLSGRRFEEPAPATTMAGPAESHTPAARTKPVRPEPARTPPAPPGLPPLAAIERRLLTALKRGTRPIEGVIDLHGMRQDEAHQALHAFVVRSQARGARLVLVVTGKGGSGSGDDARGVLRRNVPHWLRMADLRAYVLGFEDAARQHGGEGALYVRLRRSRELP